MENSGITITFIIGATLILGLLVVLHIFTTTKKETDRFFKIEAGEGWNKMIDLWSDSKLNDPIKDVITYDAEVQNGGHLQFFENCQDEMDELMSSLKKQLPKEMYKNLEDAYELYKQKDLTIETVDDYVEEAQLGDFDKFDYFYYENEKKIYQIMQEYAFTLDLDD